MADLQACQDDLTEGRKGPPVAQAFVDGQPGAAAIGFARRCGIEPSELDVRETPKGPCVFATVRTPGQPSRDLLQGLIPGWIDALQGRRFMRWGTGGQRFSRPIRWLVALLGADLIPVELEGADPRVCSDRFSRGHRLHGDAPVEISDAESYVDTLASHGVLVDRDARAELIQSAIDSEAEAVGGVPDCPESLFEELVDLVEDPRSRSAIAERFWTSLQGDQHCDAGSPALHPLDVPDVKSDPLRLKAQSVLRPFLLVSNGRAEASARSSEAMNGSWGAPGRWAFWPSTVATQHPSTGSLWVAAHGGRVFASAANGSNALRNALTSTCVTEADCGPCQRAAHLCKHDLVSQMVGELSCRGLWV